MTRRGASSSNKTSRAARAAVIFTRPSGQAGRLLRAARALGARAANLPPTRIATRAIAARELVACARAEIVIFTSPNAVRAAWRLRPTLKFTARALVLGVGPATVAALARRGVKARSHADRFDSEGLLALAELRALEGRTVALITAPGGRDLLDRGLRARGARVTRVDVYEREAARWDARHFTAIARLDGTGISVWSSVDALERIGARLDTAAWRALAATRAIVASDRVAAAARAAGFRRVKIASSARSRDLIDALRECMRPAAR